MPGKRLNGEGSVYQRSSDGRWVGAVTVGFNEAGRPVRKTVECQDGCGGTREAAQHPATTR